MAISAGEVSVRLSMDPSGLIEGVNEAKNSMSGLGTEAQVAAGQTQEATNNMATGAEQSSGRIAQANALTGGSMRGLVVGMSATMTSAFGLYRAFDDIEKKQYLVEKAHLANDRAVQGVTKAQDDYNAAIEKYGPDSDQAKEALTKLTIAQDAQSLTEERMTLTQKSLNDQFVMAGLTIIPAVVTGIDGMAKMWKNIKDLDVIGHLGGIKTALTGLGSAKLGALGGTIAGIGALYFLMQGLNTQAGPQRDMYEALTMVLAGASAAMWALGFATAFTESLTVIGLVAVGAAVAAMAGVYLMYSSMPAPAPAPAPTDINAAINGGGGGGGGSSNVTVTDLYRDINGNYQTADYLLAHPSMQRNDYQDTEGNAYDFQSYLPVPDYMRKYAAGGWAVSPQLALLGEKEPELVIPKSKWNEMNGRGQSIINNFYIDGSRDVDTIMSEIAKRMRQTTGVKF